MKPNFERLHLYLYRRYRALVNSYKSLIRKILPHKQDPSQAGEAQVLKKLFDKNYIGTLVEIGAHDGASLSNSSLLIEQGWSALLIEPLPGPYNRLAQKYQQNQNVTCLNLAIANTTGSQKFHIGADGPDGMKSTLCQDDNAWFANNKSDVTIDVSVDILTNVLQRWGKADHFDLLLVDAEGMDYECLQSLDFELFSPNVIVTEIYEWNIEKHISKRELLAKQGYSLFRVVSCNEIWVSRRFAQS